MWADWWGFKMEALDGIHENIALVHEAGACAIVHSDTRDGIQRLNQEAAKAMCAGRHAGINDHSRAGASAGSPPTRRRRSASTAPRHARARQDRPTS